MSRDNRSHMRKVYMQRRIAALVILLLVVILIVRSCSKPKDPPVINDTQLDPNSNITEDNNQILTPIENLDNEPVEDDRPLDSEEDDEEPGDKGAAITGQVEEMNTEFGDQALAYFDDETNTVEIEIKDTLKISVDNIFDDAGDDTDYENWEIFKDQVIKASESITEEVEPGITLKAINKDGMTETVLSVKDGSVSYDLVE